MPPDDTSAPVVKWPFLAVMLIIALSLFGLRSFLPAQSPRAQRIAPPDESRITASQPLIKVHVVGEVQTPGLYECKSGERVQDAIIRAGGATSNANINAVNLSAFVEDGQQINIPSMIVAKPAPAPTLPQTVASQQTMLAEPLDLNTATKEQLEALPAIGPVTAEKILALRQQKNGFRSVEELDEVSGIGPKKLDEIRPLVAIY